MAKAGIWPWTDAEARRCGEQTGLDTLVVRTVNDVHQESGSSVRFRSKRNECTAWGVCSQG